MQKARRRVSAPTACGHTGSGSISSPSRGAFHRSLAVLCAIGLPGVFSLAGWAPLIPTGLPVSCRTQARREAPGVVPVRGYHPLRPRLSSRVPVRRPAPHVRRPTTPARPRPHRFGLLPVRSPLLGESIFLSPPAGTGMFRFPAFARIAACAPSRRAGCPIRTPPDLVPFADPRGVSPLTASFIASGSLIVSNRLLVSRCCISFRLLDVLYLYCFSHNISMNNRFSQTGCKGTTFFQPCKFFKLKFKKKLYVFL